MMGPDQTPDLDDNTDSRTVVGLFDDTVTAQAALRELQAAGFPPERVGMAIADSDTLQASAVLVTVEAGTRADEAVLILERCQSPEFSVPAAGAEATGQGRTNADMPAGKIAPDVTDETAGPEQPAGVLNLDAVEGYRQPYRGPERRRRTSRRYVGNERRAAAR
jgi:hypothetical protein